MAFDFASALSGAAQATPYGAIAKAVTDIAATPNTSSANQGPVSGGPVNVNVAGFGSKSSGNATNTPTQTQSLTQAEPDRGMWFPSSSVGDATGGGAFPVWAVPAAIGGLLLLLAVVALRR